MPKYVTPGSDYASNFLDDLIEAFTYPEGRTYYEDGKRKNYDPKYLSPYDRRDLEAQASVNEDEALRYALGSKRKRKENDRRQLGNTSLAKYPGIEHQIWSQEAGFMPKGYSWRNLAGEDEDDFRDRQKKQRHWAIGQRLAVGMPGSGINRLRRR